MTAQKSIFIALDGSSNGTVPKGARLALGGLIEHDGSADPLGVKLGVLEDTQTPVVAGTTGMSYDIRAAVFVTNPTGSAANGPTVGGNDATVNVVTTAAPGSNSRYDVVWVRQHVVAADGGADSDNILEFGVTQGTTAASPSVPAIPTGALALANVLVTSGTTATNTLTFTRAHNWVRARSGQGLRDAVVFTSSGTFVKANYPWLKAIRVRVQGGGGAGGGAATTTAAQGSAGDGGGGGGYSEKIIPVGDLADSEVVTVGNGGTAASAGGAGGAGQNSSFGSHAVGNGGSGGNAGGALSNTVANIQAGTGGTGGGATSGDINIPGGTGTSGEAVWNSARARGGKGGDSQMGRGAPGQATSTRQGGVAGGNYGGGSSGGACTASQSAIGSFAGAPGIVIVELFG